jgi:hypothetical protein
MSSGRPGECFKIPASSDFSSNIVVPGTYSPELKKSISNQNLIKSTEKVLESMEDPSYLPPRYSGPLVSPAPRMKNENIRKFDRR